ncbi:hypothetical protein FQR65_LT04600 [Abscondita terminalis]|nr:hypothetical protein FQR65_LT04600 [Abscondita terminalis]
MSLKLGFTADQIVKDGRVTLQQIESVRCWSVTQNLPKLLDEQIVLFLLSCDNNIELTKNTIISHYAFKHRFPEVFTNRNINSSELQTILKCVGGCELPIRLNGCTIVINTFIDNNYENFDLTKFVKIICMCYDSFGYDSPPEGIIVITDCKNFTPMFLTKLKISLLKAVTEYVQEGAPVRIKGLHIVNCGLAMDMAYKIIKPFINREAHERIHLHRNDDQIHSFIPKKYLPKEYGGDLESISVYQQKGIEKLMRLQEYFELEEQQHRLGSTISLKLIISKHSCRVAVQ